MRSLSSPRAVSMMIGTCGGGGPSSQAAADLDPADALDHPVEHDQVGRALRGEKQRLVTVGGADDFIAFAGEMPDQQIGEGAIVLDQQQERLGHGHLPA